MIKRNRRIQDEIVTRVIVTGREIMLKAAIIYESALIVHPFWLVTNVPFHYSNSHNQAP